MISRSSHSDPADSPPGKRNFSGGCLAVFALPFLLVGLFLMWTGGLRPIITALDTRWNWTETPCTIVRSAVTGEKKTGVKPEIAYEYAYQGTTYTGTTIDRARNGIGTDRANAREIVARHPAGKPDTCRINPKAPAQSTLEYGIPGVVWVGFLFGGVFATAGGTMIFFGIRSLGKRTVAGTDDQNPVRTVKSGRKGTLSVGLIFFALGAGVLYGLGIHPAWKGHCAKDWPRVPCRIISSEVGGHSGKGTSYSVDIEYEYAYHKNTYRSGNYTFVGGSSSGYSAKRAAVDAFPAGSTRECFVNPADPGEAVLSLELGWPTWVFGFGLGGVFTLIGGLCLYGVAFGDYDDKGLSTNEVAGADGRLRLKPEIGPVAAFLGLLIFCLILNGFLSFALTGLVSENNPEWGGVLVLSIFAIFGLFILHQTGKAFLALFSPRVIVEIDRRPAVGGKLAMQWRIRGDALKLRSLALRLEAYREYTTGSGKGKRTHKEILHSLGVHRTDGRVMESGSASVAIPENLPPTDDFVRWRVTVRADVSGGVDVSTDHLLTVLPAKNSFA